MSQILKNCLVYMPLDQPPTLVNTIRRIFPKIYYCSGLAGGDPSKLPTPTSPAPSGAELAAADALFCFHLPPNLTSFAQTPSLKLLQIAGSGTAQITATEFYKSVPKGDPLTVASSAGIHVPAISEHVLMTTMALYHKMQEIADISRGQKRWASLTELGGLHIQELRGQTVGIIGYGHIGRQVARLATAFGSNVIACTRAGVPRPLHGGYHIPGTGDPDGSLPSEYYTTTSRKSLHEFLSECDVVVNLLPTSEATKGIIGRKELEVMKDTALVIAVGRGDTMDYEALTEALQEEGPVTGRGGSLKIAGASFDVTNPEPLPNNHILFSLPNCIVTPHVSYASKVNFVRAVELLGVNKQRMENGMGVLNAVRGRGEFD